MTGSADAPLLGAVLAGGESRRFGSPKALAAVEGVPMALRAARILAAAGLPVVVVTHRDDVAATVEGEVEAVLGDRIAGGGPLAGLHAALHHAERTGRSGVVLLGCDLPLVPPGLIRLLASTAAEGPPGECPPERVDAPEAWVREPRASGSGSSRAVAPESRAPSGLEPLPAVYPTRWLAEVERRLTDEREEARGLTALLGDLGARPLPLARVRRLADPESVFLNVNTPEDRERAEERARRPTPS